MYISNTTNRLQGTLCFKDKHFSASTIPAVFNTTCTLNGQYVIYYNERLNNVTYPADYSELAESDLCEVEVYGKCLLKYKNDVYFIAYFLHVHLCFIVSLFYTKWPQIIIFTFSIVFVCNNITNQF